MTLQGTFFGSIWCEYRVIYTTGTFTHQWNVQLKNLAGVLYVRKAPYFD